MPIWGISEWIEPIEKTEKEYVEWSKSAHIFTKAPWIQGDVLMKEIRLILSKNVNDAYIENLVFLMELYPYVNDQNLMDSIEERVNEFNTGKWINLSEIKKDELLSLYWDYVKMADEKRSFYLIDSDYGCWNES